MSIIKKGGSSMKNQLFSKLKESLVSVLPVTLIVIILSFTPLFNISLNESLIFIISAILLIVGISFFNLGADLAMQPMGEQVGASLMKTKKIPIIVIVCFLIGLLITIAEPDLSVLASQVKGAIDGTLLIISIGVGVGVFLVLAILKIIFKKELSFMIMFFYMILFALVSLVVINGNVDFLALAFDSGGVTTGPITVPFIMALGVGIATTVGGKNSSENSFGLIALCSIGPILAILILGIFLKNDIPYVPMDYEISTNFSGFIKDFLISGLHVTKGVSIALSLIVIFFLIMQFLFLKLPKKKIGQIFVGILYTLIGLIIFLTAVEVGFLPIGYKIGTQLADKSPYLIVILGFILGFVVVLAEPAIHVLNKQVEEITSGGVSKRSMLVALSCGVGLSIALSMIRIIFDFSILYYLIPGYFISLGLSFFVPKIYTAIAFDSGGVASGPLTSSFILPFAIGICTIFQGQEKVMADAFGIVAMVAMTPLISIQLLGFKAIMTKRVKEKNIMKRIIASDDEQIINFK